jgi:hypothetical protein
MKCKFGLTTALSMAFLLVCVTPTVAAIDGTGIPSEGLTLRATQDTPTGFGNATGGGQDSAGGSELDQLFADISGNTLSIGLTGNLEANYNKLWIFFDAVPGGESTLSNDNADGGFGEINNLAGLSFGGPTMDHALRFEVGGGFLGIRYADLIANTGGDIYTDGAGTGALPLTNVAGALGVTIGWDNSNVLGVDGSSAAGAATATKGIELAIDMPSFFGASPSGVTVSAFISSGDGTYLSNQVLPGIGGGGNIGSPNGVTIGTVAIPEPGTCLLLVVGGLTVLAARRRR